MKIGERVYGYIINDAGEDVRVEGTYEFRTDDPEEYIQDIGVRLDNGELQYVDEQEVRSF
jgi:membrane protease subunit (stomatin/prohibitin family)